jgi:hypothetical protein
MLSAMARGSRKLQASRTVTAELTRRANTKAVPAPALVTYSGGNRGTSSRTKYIALRSPKVHVYGVE